MVAAPALPPLSVGIVRDLLRREPGVDLIASLAALGQFANRMLDLGVRQLPVVDGGRVVGGISDGDLLPIVARREQQRTTR